MDGAPAFKDWKSGERPVFQAMSGLTIRRWQDACGSSGATFAQSATTGDSGFRRAVNPWRTPCWGFA